MSTSGSVDRLLIRLMSLSISFTRCHSCSRIPFKQPPIQARFGVTGRSTLISHNLSIGSQSPFLVRSYSTSSTSSVISTTQQATTTDSQHHAKINWRPLGTDQARQRDATTSIAMIHCAKRNDPDQCLQHYLQLLRSQGRLPSHEALHQLARVLYINRHVSGFAILHDTLLAYHTLYPPSAKQSRNLTYMYTMLINLVIRQPSNKINGRLSPKKKPHKSSTPSSLQQIIPTSFCDMSSPSLINVPLLSSSKTETPPETATPMERKKTTVIQLCQEMGQLGLTGTPAFYNSLLKFCVMKKDTDLAWHFFNELVLACTPTRYTFSILLDLTRQQRDPSRTLWLLDTMHHYGVLPDRAMASTVMLTLCDHHQYTDAADLIDQLAHQCPQLMGPIYKSVLMATLQRHYGQHGVHLARRRRRLAKRKRKRRQARLQEQQQQQQQSQQQPQQQLEQQQ